MLSVQQVACVKGGRYLFKEISFDLASGQLIYVEGANGAGKTSLLRILAGLSPCEQGQVCWSGSALKEAAESYTSELRYLGHAPAVKESLTVLENLHFMARLSGSDFSSSVLENALFQVGLSNKQHLAARFLSQGQRRRLALAKLWLDHRPLWILDEPFTALDAQAIQRLADKMQSHLQAEGMIVLTSHQTPPIAEAYMRSLKLNG